MQTPRKIIRFVDTSVYDGPTTMEELRAQTMAMTVSKADQDRENLKAAQKCTYDRETILMMIAEGHKLKTIAQAVGASESLISRIKTGKR